MFYLTPDGSVYDPKQASYPLPKGSTAINPEFGDVYAHRATPNTQRTVTDVGAGFVELNGWIRVPYPTFARDYREARTRKPVARPRRESLQSDEGHSAGRINASTGNIPAGRRTGY